MLDNIATTAHSCTYIALSIAFCVTGGCSHDTPASSGDSNTTVQKVTADQLRLLDLDGQPVDVWQNNRNEVTVFLFARTDCPISNRYAPEVRRLFEMFHPQGIGFYLVYVDPHEPVEEIRKHLDDYSYPCRAVRDPEHTLVELSGATRTPEAAVYDRDHQLVYRGRIDDIYVDFGKARTAPTTRDLANALNATLSGEVISERFTASVGCYISDLKKK